MKKKLKLLTSAIAFNNSGWKLDDNGAIVVKDGNPVFVDSSGREMTMAQDTIARLNGEAKAHREAKEALESRLKSFEGLDSEKARKAVDLVAKLDAKQLIDAGKVDEVKNQITQQFQTQLTEKDGLIKTLQSKLDDMAIDSVFSNSDFIRDNIAVPRDMFVSFFRQNFKVEDGKVVAYGRDGNRLMSKANMGEYASAEEALALLVDQHSQKEIILKADVGSGSGSQGGGGARGGGRTVKRADFEKMNPVQKTDVLGKIGKGEMVLTD